jgi:hypothetical protein
MQMEVADLEARVTAAATEKELAAQHLEQLEKAVESASDAADQVETRKQVRRSSLSRPDEAEVGCPSTYHSQPIPAAATAVMPELGGKASPQGPQL